MRELLLIERTHRGAEPLVGVTVPLGPVGIGARVRAAVVITVLPIGGCR